MFTGADFRTFCRVLRRTLFACVLCVLCVFSPVYAEEITYPFSVTTTTLPDNDKTFKFTMSAKGTFYVDCGGGTLSGTGVGEDGITINRSDVDTSQLTSGDTYTCTYSNTSPKTIRFGGETDAYNYSHYYPNSTNILLDIAPISFSGSGAKVRSVDGNLSAIFPVKGTAGNQKPKFYQTFMGCTNLTELPETLFDNITSGGEHMFKETFKGCSGLREIPGNLFSKLIKSPGIQQFRETFAGCSSLKRIPAGLFDFGTRDNPHNVGGANSMFWETFKNCTGLQTTYDEDNNPIEPIPADLFSHVTSTSIGLFHGTFYGCSNITSIPEDLFNFHGNYIDGGYTTFAETFALCKKLKSIPAGLFSHIKSAVNGNGLFEMTFNGCEEIESIPADLFKFNGNYVDGKEAMFWGTFAGCKKVKTIPSGLFSQIKSAARMLFADTFLGTGLEVTYDGNNNPIEPIPADLFNFHGNDVDGKEDLFYAVFKGCTKLKTIPAGLFSHVKTGAPRLFHATFEGCTGLEYIPENLFASIKTKAPSMFMKTFRGCSGFVANPDAEEPSRKYNFIPKNLFSVADPDEGIDGIVPNSGTYPEMMMYQTFDGTTLRTDCPVGYVQYITGYEDYWNGHVSCEIAPLEMHNVNYQVPLADSVNVTNLPDSPASAPGGYYYTLATAPSAEKYIFTGWRCRTDEEEPAVVCNNDLCGASEEIVMPWSDITCVAQWRVDPTAVTTYNVIYSNLFPFSNQISTDIAGGNHPYQLAGAPTATGYKFTGWRCQTDEAEPIVICDTCNASQTITMPSANLLCVAQWDCDVNHGYLWNNGHTACITTSEGYPFWVTTTKLQANSNFRFTITAKGEFTVDCGEGGTLSGEGVVGNTITRNTTWHNNEWDPDWTFEELDSDEMLYTCHYETGGEKVVRFRGNATQYWSGDPTIARSTISFGSGFSNLGCGVIKTINGDLSAIFPRLSGTEQDKSPVFDGTFAGCKNVKQIPATLFSQYTVGGKVMFLNTFNGCTGLGTDPKIVNPIPGALFSHIADPGNNKGENMFTGVFANCTNLKKIPGDLFNSITTASGGLFTNAFKGCNSLTSIPEELFANVSTVWSSTFAGTFSDCTSLTSIPSGLFSNVTTTQANLFNGTFRGCTGLKYLPENLFASVRDIVGGPNTFYETFSGCNGLTTNPDAEEPSAKYNFIPANFFSISTNGVSGLINEANPSLPLGGDSMMTGMFDGTTLDTRCPAGYYQFVTGYEQQWDGHVSCKQCPSGTYSLAGADGPEDCVAGFEIDLTQSPSLEWNEGPTPSKLYTIQNVGVYLDPERTKQMKTNENNIQIPTVDGFIVEYDANAPENPITGLVYDTNPIENQVLSRTYTGFGIDNQKYVDENGFITSAGIQRAVSLRNNESWVAKDYSWDSANVRGAASLVDAEGYVFKNWYDNSEGEGEPVTQLSSTSHPEKLYGSWDGETVTYNCGEGTGEPWLDGPYAESATVTLLESPGIHCIAPEHRPFIGWQCTYVDDVGNNILIEPENGEFSMPGYSVTCTAQWQQWLDSSFIASYRSFYCGGNVGWVSASGVGQSNIRPDNEFTVSHPTMNGHIFNGWNIEDMDNNDTHYYSDSQIVIDGVIQPGTQTTNDTSLSNITATHFMNLRTTPGSVVFTADWLCDTENGWHPTSDNSGDGDGPCTPCTNRYRISYNTGNLAGTGWCPEISPVDYPSYQYAMVGEQNYQLRNVAAFYHNSNPSLTNCFVGPQYTFEPWACTRDDNGETVLTADSKILEMPASAVTCTTNWVCAEGYSWNNDGTACVPISIVEYSCGEAEGENWQGGSYAQGDTVTVPDTPGEHCNASELHRVFTEWSCQPSVILDENRQFSMPGHPVTCTAQWDNCDTGYYWADNNHTTCEPGYEITLQNDKCFIWDVSPVPPKLYTIKNTGVYLDAARTQLMQPQGDSIEGQHPIQMPSATFRGVRDTQTNIPTNPDSAGGTYVVSTMNDVTTDAVAQIFRRNNVDVINDSGYVTGQGVSDAISTNANIDWSAQAWLCYSVGLGNVPEVKDSEGHTMGYTGNWYTNSDGTGDLVTHTMCAWDNCEKSVTYYAKWTPNHYSVTYNKGAHATANSENYVDAYDEDTQTGGATFDEPYTALDFEAAPISDHMFAATGYVFAGWTTDSTPIFEDGVLQNRFTGYEYWKNVDNLTVYAAYQCDTENGYYWNGSACGNDYTITYVVDAPAGANITTPGQDTVSAETEHTLATLTIPDGYTWTGWDCRYTDTNGEHTLTPNENNEITMPPASVTCTGTGWDCDTGYHWTNDSHTACSNTLNLVWDTKGANNDAEVMENLPESCTYKTGTIELTTPTKTGYDFKGWKVVNWDQNS